MDNVQKNIEVIHKLNDLVNSMNYDGMDQYFADTYIDHNSSWQIKSLEDLKNTLKVAKKNFDIQNTILDTVASEDKVVVRIMINGKHIAPAFGIEPTGKKTSCETIEIYRLENCKIVERWVLSDVVGLMKQLGVKLPI